MKWTKLHAALNERIAPSLHRRVAIHQARYRRTAEEVGRVWITLDGEEIASFDTNSYVSRRAAIGNEIRSGLGPWGLPPASNYQQYLAADQAAVQHLREAGLHDDYVALAELEGYLSLGVKQAMASQVPLVRAMAMIDRRLGKRRLVALELKVDEHQLVKILLAARMEAEGLTRNTRAV